MGYIILVYILMVIIRLPFFWCYRDVYFYKCPFISLLLKRLLLEVLDGI